MASCSLVGLAAELLGRRTTIPRVTLRIIAGVAFGPSLLGWLGATYIVARVAGRLLGTSVNVRLRDMPEGTGRWMGVALLPQAGVAVGMALVAAQQFPERAEVLLSVVLASAVVFEIVGPPMTRLALRRVKEAA